MTAAKPDPLATLRAPLPETAISYLPRVTCKDCSNARDRVCDRHRKERCTQCGSYMTTAHVDLSYAGHAAVTDRFLDADLHWTWEPFALDDHGLPLFDRNAKGEPVGLWIKLTVAGQTRPGYGSVEGGKSDAVKELIGDALRNAAMRFGVGLELWHKGDLHADEPPAAPPAAADQEQRPSALPASESQVTQIDELLAALPPETSKKALDALVKSRGQDWREKLTRDFAEKTVARLNDLWKDAQQETAA